MEINRTELNMVERDIRSCLLSQEPMLTEVSVAAKCDYGSGIFEVTVVYRTKDLEDTVTVPLYADDRV